MRASGAPVRLGRPLIRVGELGSTNDFARTMAEAGLPEGAVVVARRQTHGRGRRGRPWSSPPGGLWCSILLRPPGDREWGQLSLAMAVAVAEAIDESAGVHAAIRWPNDVLLNGCKVAGILLEGVPGAIVLGVGINANVPAAALPPDLRSVTTSLHTVVGQDIGLDSLLDGLLARAGYWYAAWMTGSPQVLAAWSARDATHGGRIVADSQGASIEGVAVGVDPDGALRVRLPDGDVRRVVAGDLAVARPAGGQEPVA